MRTNSPLLHRKARVALLAGTLLASAVSTQAMPNNEQPYIWDYYNSGMTAAEYVATYKGEAYKGPREATNNKVLKIEAEDFDNGGEGISYSFRNKDRNNNYRPGITDVAINSHAGGYVIGNVSGGDWLCYTIEVKDEGEYLLTTNCCADNIKTFYYEVDGKSAGNILHTPGQGWDKYVNVANPGLQLSAGKHIIKWVPSGSMNINYFTLERTGNYTPPADEAAHFEYPRYATYTHNPLFTDLTSPMYGSGFTGALYTADPSAHVWNIDGKQVLYVYASHDMEPPVGCDRMDRYHIFSTEDLVNWTDHGEIMNATTSNQYTGTTGEGFMWAPDCAYNAADGLYYFIYPHKINLEEGIDIESNEPASTTRWGHFLATSENPAGPFKCIGYIKGVPSTIDPSIFVDDDGQAYLYTSGNGQGCWGGKLKAGNWLEIDGEYKPLVGHDGTKAGGFDDFHEAPWMFKKDGRYYLCHSDNNSGNNNLRYSVADDPLGPFTPMGVFMNPHGHDTAHGSVVEFNGKWYSFYHTADYSAKGNLRSVCFDELTFAANGNINMVNTWGQPAAGSPIEVSKETPVTIQAGEYNNGGNARGYYTRTATEPSRTGSIALNNEEWLRYSIDVKEKDRYAFTIRARQSIPGSKITIMVNGDYKTGEQGIALPTNKMNEWQELYVYPVILKEGEQYLELRVKNGAMEIEEFTVSTGQALVPGVIQAEDLEAGDYSFKDETAARNQHGYRDDVWVAISTGNGATHIGNTSAGDYFTYAFKCTNAGVYDITGTLAVSASNSEFKISIDGKAVAATRKITGSDWKKWFTETFSGVELTEGIHTMRFDVVRGPMNIDKFEFVRKGNLTGINSTLADGNAAAIVDVYSLDGRLLKNKVETGEALDGLERGIYIVGKRKMIKW